MTAEIYYQRIRFYSNRMFLLEGDEKEEAYEKVSHSLELNEEVLANYDKGIDSEEDRQLFDKLSILWNEYKPRILQVVDYEKSGQSQIAKDLLFGEVADIGSSLQDAFSALSEYNTNEGRIMIEANTRLVEQASETMTFVVLAGIIIALVLGFYISRIISKPINAMVLAADSMALGDINVDVKADTRDVIGKLAESFRRMVENIRAQALVAEQIAEGNLTVDVPIRSEKDLLGKKLAQLVQSNNEILTEIAAAADQVAMGAKQVSDSSIVLSQGATEQASSIEELTASLEEISSQTKLNADNASQANNLVDEAKMDAAQGNTHMKEMLQAIYEINEASSNISKIIKVIDDIAFQTNILALNAAVEAARAGQHGKGFAVVAEEVRNLAARSADAARETTDMIEGSIKKTEEGTRIAKETADALAKIVNEVDKVAALVNDIAIASNEQATGISQINQGILQVSEVVQNNSATSEEGASASEELSGQTGLLKEMVSRYRLKKDAKGLNGYEKMNPDVMKMLDNMAAGSSNGIMAAGINEPAPARRAINLNDNDFGKY
ncbi:MAG: methyl-accepting chemotaxis protein [Clostridiales bacterium]|nr:methyl-accepting chemotaxis protein [Clostridiales bacterium]